MQQHQPNPDRAIFGTETFGSQTPIPPLLSSNVSVPCFFLVQYACLARHAFQYMSKKASVGGRADQPVASQPSPGEASALFSCQKCRRTLVVSSKCTLEDNAPRRVHEEKAWMAVSAQEMLQREGAGDSDWIAVTNRLLDFVSEVVQHDQPLCPDCTEIMVADLEKELRSSEAERDHYCGFLKEWEAEDEAMITAQERQLNKELQQLEKEEAQLMQVSPNFGHWGRTVRCARAVRKVGCSPPPGVR